LYSYFTLKNIIINLDVRQGDHYRININPKNRQQTDVAQSTTPGANLSKSNA